MQVGESLAQLLENLVLGHGRELFLERVRAVQHPLEPGLVLGKGRLAGMESLHGFLVEGEVSFDTRILPAGLVQLIRLCDFWRGLLLDVLCGRRLISRNTRGLFPSI